MKSSDAVSKSALADGQPADAEESFAHRLRKAADAKSLSQSGLAARSGVPPGRVNEYWNGPKEPSPRNLFAIAEALEVSPRWLLDGAPEPEAVADRRIGWRGFEPETEGDSVELDEIDLRYGLGGSYVEGAVTVRKQRFPRDWLRRFTSASPEMLFWAQGDGDSMEPTIRSGEVILIDRSLDSPRSGDGIWAIAFGEIGMIKRLRPLPNGTVEIHSDNPLVPPASAADGEMHVVGRVVAVVRRL